MRKDPVLYWNFIHPERTSRTSACPADALTANFTSVFDLPCEPTQPVCDRPNPPDLPFTPDDLASALTHGFAASKSSGPSTVPTQLLKYLSADCYASLSSIFNHFAATSLPAAWLTSSATAIHKKGDPTVAANYRCIAVMGPFCKLFASCLNRELTRQSDQHAWRAPTQVGFRRHHRLEDMVLAVDFAIDRAKAQRKPLALAFLDLEKAFDRVPRDRLVTLLLTHYNVNPSIVETIRRMYENVTAKVPGSSSTFRMTMGVKQGCPMSPLLFGLFFDRVVAFVSTHLPADSTSDLCYSIAFLVIQLALYADDIAVLAPSVPACQRMVDHISTFCVENGLTINTADDKSQVMLLNCVGNVHVNGANLCQVTAFKYLGITLRSEGYSTRRMRGVG